MKKFCLAVLMLFVYLSGCALPNTDNAQNQSSTSTLEQLIKIISEQESEDEKTSDVAEPGIWAEYIKTDDFGDVVEKDSKDDICLIGYIKGTGTTSISVNEYDYDIGFGISDYTLWGYKAGEYVVVIPVSSLGGTTVISLSQKATIQAKTSSEEKYTRKGVKLNNGVFYFSDKQGFFTEHLKNGEDIQCVLTTENNDYKFKFTLPCSNYKAIYDDIAADPPKISKKKDVKEDKEIIPIFDKETAKKVAYVAINNVLACDVYTEDGSELDKNKLHSFSDKSGCYMEINALGSWEPVDENTWRGKRIQLVPKNNSENFDENEVITSISCTVYYDGEQYEVSNLDGWIANSNNLAQGKDLKIPEKNQVALVVTADLLE